jgi:Tol biopolymer transport system component
MAADGTDLHLLHPTCCFYSVAWARGGRQLLLGGSDWETSNDGIYELRIKDQRLRRLTHGSDSDAAASATGAIALVRATNPRAPWIYVMSRAGAKPRRLLRGTDPDWSPDGKRIAFARSDGIYTASASGHGLRKLTDSREDQLAPGREPAWSSSGKRIAFVRYPHIYIVRPDGTRVREVHLGSPYPSWASPSWQPLR